MSKVKIKKGCIMTYKEFIRKSDNVRRKRDIILLSELLDLYDAYFKSKKKEPIEPIIIYNEIHDCLNYSEREIEIIIQQAQILRNEQNQ
ncbi:MAG: hypothetical protein ACLUFU_05695 [Bacilli bacterium]